MDNANGLLRVLLVAMEYTPKVSGGVGTYVFELANGLARAGCAVTVLAYTPGEAAVLHQPNLEVHLIAPRKETFNSASGASLVQGILTFNDDLVRYAKEHLASWRPDIVHFHQWHTRDAGRRFPHHLTQVGPSQRQRDGRPDIAGPVAAIVPHGVDLSDRRRRDEWLARQLRDLTPEQRQLLRAAAPILQELSDRD